MLTGRDPIAALRTPARLWTGNADPSVTGSSGVTVELNLVTAYLEMRAHDAG